MMLDEVWVTTILISAFGIALQLALINKDRRDARTGAPRTDERLQIISGRAAIGSMAATTIFIIGEMLWALVSDAYPQVPLPATPYLLLAVVFVVVGSFASFRWFYSRPGESA
jgi:hypothetical protein